jgi:hypothetical protein
LVKTRACIVGDIVLRRYDAKENEILRCVGAAGGRSGATSRGAAGGACDGKLHFQLVSVFFFRCKIVMEPVNIDQAAETAHVAKTLRWGLFTEENEVQ